MKTLEFFGGPWDGTTKEWPDDVPVPRRFDLENPDGYYERDQLSSVNFDWWTD